MNFEWDEEKRESNLAKHGVDFVRAARIFENLTIEHIDDRHDYGEERIIALGHADGFFIVVVYVWRNETRRIISARKASSHDQAAYDKRIAGGAAADEGPDEG